MEATLADIDTDLGNLRERIASALRLELPAIVKQLSAAFGAGAIGQDAYEELVNCATAKQYAPPAPRKAVTNPRIYVGSRPRSPKSTWRRITHVKKNWLPDASCQGLTVGMIAVASVIAQRVAQAGVCELSVPEIAARAGVSDRWVQVTQRVLVDLGLISIERRRVSAFWNRSNRVRVVCKRFLRWLDARVAWRKNVVNRTSPHADESGLQEENGVSLTLDNSLGQRASGARHV